MEKLLLAKLIDADNILEWWMEQSDWASAELCHEQAQLDITELVLTLRDFAAALEKAGGK